MVVFTREALKQWTAKSLASSAHAVSDGLWCFEAGIHTVAQHGCHVVGSGKLAVQHPEFRWVNTLLGNRKTALSRTYHAFNHAKYAHRYVAEFSYRFNRSFDLIALILQLLRTAVTTNQLPLSILKIFEANNY
nr:transposase [Nitrosomonas supralitoralis]